MSGPTAKAMISAVTASVQAAHRHGTRAETMLPMPEENSTANSTVARAVVDRPISKM